MKPSHFAASFWLACGLLGVVLLASVQSQSPSPSTAPKATQSPASQPSPAPQANQSPPVKPPVQTSQTPLPESAPPPIASSARFANPTIPPSPVSKSGESEGDYSQMIPKNAVFGCDDPGPGLRDGNGGTTNNALIVTQTSPSGGSSVYGRQQGDLVIFTKSDFNALNLKSPQTQPQVMGASQPQVSGVPQPQVTTLQVDSGALRCAQTARYLNYFVQNPNEFQGFIFRVDDSSKPHMICYAPSGAPCGDTQARLVMLLPRSKDSSSALDALQKFTTNLNLMRNVPGSEAVYN